MNAYDSSSMFSLAQLTQPENRKYRNRRIEAIIKNQKASREFMQDEGKEMEREKSERATWAALIWVTKATNRFALSTDQLDQPSEY